MPAGCVWIAADAAISPDYSAWPEHVAGCECEHGVDMGPALAALLAAALLKTGGWALEAVRGEVRVAEKATNVYGRGMLVAVGGSGRYGAHEWCRGGGLGSGDDCQSG